MKRGRGRPPKTPTYSSKLLNSGRRGSHHGGPSSPRVSTPQGVKTRDSNRSTQRKNYFEGIQFTESDSDSDSSYESSVSSVVSSVRSYKSRRVKIPMRTVTLLKLPPSSDDLILPPEHVLQALGIYEVLRQFGRILRLSPFRFEDFCAAIESAEQSVLLSQVHMALFRALLLEDETNGYTFAASDEKDSLNIFLHEVDCFTWPEHIRSYFYSDRSEFSDLSDLMCGRDPENPFPFVSIGDRLKVLKRLCDLFLASNTVREVIINEGITESEDHCRGCCKMGDLLCCENCPAVYHLHCLKPPLEMVPDGDWLCPICDEHRLKGVTDCQSDWTKDGWLRHTPLGGDREGRRYWFLSRRLFVESENETVRYYSSKPHLDELIGYLEADGQERRLISAIKTKYNTIIKHMAITESLIEATRGDMTSGLLARRKYKQVQKVDCSSTAMEDKGKETKPKTEVSLTFVPDTAVAKMVTKGQEEPTPSLHEKDRRTIMIEQRKNNKDDDIKAESSEKSESNDESKLVESSGKDSLDVVDTMAEQDVVKKEVSDGTSDISMQNQPMDTSKTDTLTKPNQVTKPDKDITVSTNTPSTTTPTNKERTSVAMDVDRPTSPLKKESPLSTKTTSVLDASHSSVRKVIDFSSSVSTVSSTPVETLKEATNVSTGSGKDDILVKSETEEKEKDCAELITEVKAERTVKEGAEPSKQEEEPVKQEAKPFKRETEPVKPEPKGPFFRLGMEGNFTAYVNQFATNPLALNKLQHMEYKERKRAVNNKFSVDHEFKISGEIFGPKDVILNTLRCSVVNLENNIPASFMHPIWPVQRSTWVRAVHMATTPVEFAAALLFLETLIKPFCFLHVWHDALGHTELHRAIVETKAEKKKKEHKDDEEENEYQDRVLINYSWVPMHQIWKQKGEEYRIFGGGGWTWESGMATRKRKLGVSKDRRNFETKKRRLCKVVDDFVSKREAKKKEAERKAKAKLAVQAYRDNMKTTTTQSVTSLTPGTTTVANIGIQMNTSSQKPSVTLVNTVTQVKQPAVTMTGTVTPNITTSAIKSVTQSSVTSVTQTAVNPALNTVMQLAAVPKVISITQSTVTGVTQPSVTAVTQSIPNPVMNIAQLATVPKVLNITQSMATGVTQSILNPMLNTVTQLAAIPKVMNVTQSTTTGVTQSTTTGVTQSVVSPVVNITQLATVPKVASVTQSTVTGVTQSTMTGVTQSMVSPVVNMTQLSAVPKVVSVTQSTVTGVTQSTMTGVTQSVVNPVVNMTQLAAIPKVLSAVQPSSVTMPVPNVVQSTVTQLRGVTQPAITPNMASISPQLTVMQSTVPNMANVTQPSLVPIVTNVNKPNVTPSAVLSTSVPIGSNTNRSTPNLAVTQSIMRPVVTHVIQSAVIPNLVGLVQPTKIPIAAQPMLKTNLIQPSTSLVSDVTQPIIKPVVTSVTQSPIAPVVTSKIQADQPTPKVSSTAAVTSAVQSTCQQSTVSQTLPPNVVEQTLVPSLETVKDVTPVPVLGTCEPAKSSEEHDETSVVPTQNSSISTVTQSSAYLPPITTTHHPSQPPITTSNTTNVTSSESLQDTEHVSPTKLVATSNTSTTTVTHSSTKSSLQSTANTTSSDLTIQSNSSETNIDKDLCHSKALENVCGSAIEEESCKEFKSTCNKQEPSNEDKAKTDSNDAVEEQINATKVVDGMMEPSVASRTQASTHNSLAVSAAVKKTDTDINKTVSENPLIECKDTNDNSTRMDTLLIHADSLIVNECEFKVTESISKQDGMCCAVLDSKYSCEDIEEGWVMIAGKLSSLKEPLVLQHKTDVPKTNDLMDWETEDSGKQTSSFSSVTENVINDVDMEHGTEIAGETCQTCLTSPVQNCDIPIEVLKTEGDITPIVSSETTQQAVDNDNKQLFNEKCKPLIHQEACKETSVAGQEMSADCHVTSETTTSTATSCQGKSVVSQSSSSSLATTSSTASSSDTVVASLSSSPSVTTESTATSSQGASKVSLFSSTTVASSATITSSCDTSVFSQSSSSSVATTSSEATAAVNHLPSVTTTQDTSLASHSLLSSLATTTTSTHSQDTSVVSQSSLPSVTATSTAKSSQNTVTSLVSQSSMATSTITSAEDRTVNAAHPVASTQNTSLVSLSSSPSVEATYTTTSSQDTSPVSQSSLPLCKSIITHTVAPSQGTSSLPSSTALATVAPSQGTSSLPSSTALATVHSSHGSSAVSQVASVDTTSTVVSSQSASVVSHPSSLSGTATSVVTSNQGTSSVSLSSASTSATQPSVASQSSSLSGTATSVVTSNQGTSSVSLSSASTSATQPSVASQSSSLSVAAPLVVTSSPVISTSANVKVAPLSVSTVASQSKSTSTIAQATSPNATLKVAQSVTAVNAAGQDSLGVTLAKTLINTAVKASVQNVPVVTNVKQIITTVPLRTQQRAVKTVSTVSVTRSQTVVSKPTQQLRAIAPQPRPAILPATLQPGQKAVLQTTPQTAQIAFPIMQGSVLQGANVVKINTPAGTTPGTPVNNIAALVASLPGGTGTPGQPQLIRFVTPSGATFTVQGTIQTQPAGSGGATTISVPKSMIASQASTSMKPVVVAPKTVAASATRTTVSLPRPQQPSVTTKVTKVLPEQKEKYPVLEPLLKDPRKLLDRVVLKWRKNRCGVKSVFQLKKHEMRALGRRAGMREVPGFMYVSRGSGINWPPSFPRPSFKVAWRYRTRSLRTLAGAGLQARILHASLKWEDISVRPPRSNSSTICTSTGTTTTEIINHRYVTSDGLKCEYLVRKIVRTMQKVVPQVPRPPPPTVSKRGRTLRPKINLQPDDDDDDDDPVHTGPRVFESWCPEAKLELWEIRQYNERKERERAIEREKKIQEEAIRRAAELRAAAIQRKQQEQQAKQQQQLLKKKVQNAIKTQQKKFTNLSQTTRPIVSTVYKPIVSMATNTSINQSSVIQTTVAKQTVPRITNLVTQYRPSSLNQARVPIGSPAPAGMIRTVARAQVNYRPLATTTQAKTTTGVSPAPKLVSGFQITARSSSTNAPKMKHSSKELQQAKQQIAKAKGKKSSGTATAQVASKKHVSLETRQDMNRISVCRKLVDQMIGKIERNEALERNKETKRKAVAEKQERVKATKLDGLLYKRKEILKKEIIRKRAALEKELNLEIQKDSKKELPGKKRKRGGSIETTFEGPGGKKQLLDELYCICRKPYDPTMFYIGCDLCANWFHGLCVGVTPEQAETLEQFTCTECSKAQKGVETEELYCLCRQPYDESKFYIGCDVCHDWFHGSCVGINEFEANHVDSYVCPRCKESQSNRDVQPLTSKDYDSLKRLLRSLQSHKMAWPFLEPVNADEVEGYYQIIKDPMDLSKVEDRLSSKYYHTLEQFNADITTTFDNCRFFNPKESPYYRCAEVLEGFFVKKLRAWQKKT